MPIALVMPSSHLILWFLLLLSSIFPRIKGFSNESTVQIRGPKYWSLSINPSSEYSGLISLRLTGLISLPSKGLSGVFSSITVERHQFYIALPSYSSDLTTACYHWKDHSLDYIDLCQQSDISAFNTLSRFVIVFLPRIYIYIYNLFTYLFILIGGKLFHNVVLVPAIQKHESATRIHISPPSWASLPPLDLILLGHHRASGWGPCVI